jgi:hypothetical protein
MKMSLIFLFVAIAVAAHSLWSAPVSILGILLASMFLFAALAGFITALLKPRARFRAGDRCAKCGFEFQGNAFAACPQCGTAVEERQDEGGGI